MNELHIERMAEDKTDVLPATEIGKPVPGEDALDAHDQILAVRLDQLQEGVFLTRDILVNQNLGLAIDDADIHHLCMQVDPTVMLVLTGVESHDGLLQSDCTLGW